jgi:threonine dehydrogenase-like Zn-dependent dehydrogenase
VRGAKQILGSYSGSISIWNRALSLLEKEIINLEPIISHKLPLNSIEDGFRLAQSKKGIKVIIEP